LHLRVEFTLLKIDGEEKIAEIVFVFSNKSIWIALCLPRVAIIMFPNVRTLSSVKFASTELKDAQFNPNKTLPWRGTATGM
jgi:hypothetical protein